MASVPDPAAKGTTMVTVRGGFQPCDGRAGAGKAAPSMAVPAPISAGRRPHADLVVTVRFSSSATTRCRPPGRASAFPGPQHHPDRH
ncbi:hypothetical protein GCM10010964_12060 [Caldovatus sediminis]|uniref:Uncharacterized protein n=1 Tax=Caldovatus sediminis TaxID=2041189 RepID=A0A8J3EAD6_9PROT|nr:hypothetical protein GCM10010964_12060 [Caldovatus sediminis]